MNRYTERGTGQAAKAKGRAGQGGQRRGERTDREKKRRTTTTQ